MIRFVVRVSCRESSGWACRSRRKACNSGPTRRWWRSGPRRSRRQSSPDKRTPTQRLLRPPSVSAGARLTLARLPTPRHPGHFPHRRRRGTRATRPTRSRACASGAAVTPLFVERPDDPGRRPGPIAAEAVPHVVHGRHRRPGDPTSRLGAPSRLDQVLHRSRHPGHSPAVPRSARRPSSGRHCRRAGQPNARGKGAVPPDRADARCSTASPGLSPAVARGLWAGRGRHTGKIYNIHDFPKTGVVSGA